LELGRSDCALRNKLQIAEVAVLIALVVGLVVVIYFVGLNGRLKTVSAGARLATRVATATSVPGLCFLALGHFIRTPWAFHFSALMAGSFLCGLGVGLLVSVKIYRTPADDALFRPFLAKEDLREKK
jgi:hypothetical protein